MKVDYVRLREFVESFLLMVHVDEDGLPLVDDEGQTITTARYINTKVFVLSSTPMALLGN